jgi:hypothetical protein
MEPSPPLIYIAALVRTGSTLLGELLSDLPDSYILHEPHIGKNFFALQQTDAQVFLTHGIDIAGFLRWRLPVAFFLRRLRFLAVPQDFLMKEFKFKLLPDLLKVAGQIGVKEIRQKGWENYVRHFANMRVIITARDPRDIYLSLSQLRRQGDLKWTTGRLRRPKPFNPTTVAGELNREFTMQKALMNNTEHQLLRYEDLCQDPTRIEAVKVFTQSTLSNTGSVGAFSSHHPKKTVESRLHNGQITPLQVYRWRSITDRKMREELEQVSELMAEYRTFWGYA